MPLTPASRLGPYEIVNWVGAGGMGEVYRARDTRLDRIVAIKVLPARVADRPEVRQRFEREARAVASLNHPHICSLHDIGWEAGAPFLVMEFLEGETLSVRLARGLLPAPDALRYSLEIADALDEAHRHGIVHRDLKPGNIMLTKSGAKLLDFGLAKLQETRPLARSVENSAVPTTSFSLTGEGELVGTLRYMAPEQIERGNADARTDIFAFGSIVSEMMTGRRTFQGASTATLVAAILERDPPSISEVRPEAPPLLDQIVQKCLAKNPDDRWQSARDLLHGLRWVAESRREKEAPRRRRLEVLPWAVAALCLFAALALGVVGLRARPGEAPTVRFPVHPPGESRLVGSIAVSPDGRQIAFATTTPQGSTALWVRPLDSLAARALAGTEGGRYPFWSPDNEFLGFIAEGQLKKINVNGGPPVSLSGVFDARGGTWNREGVIVYSPNFGDRLYRIDASGGKPTPVTTLDASLQHSSHQWPQFLPDGRHFLFLVWSALPEASGTYVGSLDSKESRRLFGADRSVAFARGPGRVGQLLFLRGATLMGQEFDPDALRLSGEAFPIADPIWYDGINPGLTAFSVSENGVLAYRSGGVRNTQLTWFDRNGRRVGSVGPMGAHRDLWLSPDDRQVAISSMDLQTGTHDIWLFELSRGTATRFTFHAADETTPLWSPDGKSIVFTSSRDGPSNLYQKGASGTRVEEPLLVSSVSKYPTDWSSDHRHVLFANWDSRTKWDVWSLPLASQTTGAEPQPVPYLQTEFDTFQAGFSPDGRWVAYTSNESKRYEVYVQPFPAGSGRWQISTEGGAQPQWSRSGRELFYLAPDRKLMAVPIRSGASFEPGSPRALFQTEVTGLVDARNHYVVAADGERFLVNTVVEEPRSAPINVVVNWASPSRR